MQCISGKEPNTLPIMKAQSGAHKLQVFIFAFIKVKSLKEKQIAYTHELSEAKISIKTSQKIEPKKKQKL